MKMRIIKNIWNKLGVLNFSTRGFRDYDLIYEIVIGNEGLNYEILIKECENYLKILNSTFTYKVYITIEYIRNDSYYINSLGFDSSLYVHKDINAKSLALKLMNRYNSAYAQYGIDQCLKLTLNYKVWLTESDYKSNMKKIVELIDKTMRKILKNEKWIVNFETLFMDKIYEPFLKLNKKSYSFYHEGVASNLYVVYKTNKKGVVTKGVLKDEKEFIILEWDIIYKDGLEIHNIKDQFKVVLNEKGEILEKAILGKDNIFRKPILSKEIDNNFAVFDLETYTVDESGKQEVYASAFKSKNICKSYWLEEYLTSGNLMKRMLNDIFDNLENTTLYAHNGGRFDFFLILVSLTEIADVSIVLRDINNEIISINATRLSDGKKIYIRDSYLLLPHSLEKLAEKLFPDMLKLYFPHTFVTLENLGYVGETPDIKYFPKNIKNYKKIKNWSLKNELINYVIRDVDLLFNIINLLSETIFKNFKINITNTKTLSSLSQKIYLTNFLKKQVLFKLFGPIADIIRESYAGGANFVKPGVYNNLFYYDIRSSYPAAMLKDMPALKPEITNEKNLDNIFGFVRAEISNIPDKLRCICPTHNEYGQMIFPNTTYTGVYFSEELKALVNLGAEYKILEAIKFKKNNSYFKPFVYYFYNLKYKEKGILGLIAKLLLNSLYGKFGMKDIMTTAEICDKTRVEQLEKTRIVNKKYMISENKYIVIYQKFLDTNYLELFGEIKVDKTTNDPIKYISFNASPETNIAIAAAVTAYGRMALQEIRNIPKINIIMMDTDSVLCDSKLPDNLVHEGVGGWKLEHIVSKAIIVQKKLYYFECQSSDHKTYTVKKGKGVNVKNLEEKDYIDMLNGKILVPSIEFRPHFEHGVIIKNTNKFIGKT